MVVCVSTSEKMLRKVIKLIGAVFRTVISVFSATVAYRSDICLLRSYFQYWAEVMGYFDKVGDQM